MLELSLMVSQAGLTWPRWKQLISDIEALGFAGLYTSDHYPTRGPAIETITRLTYLADHTRRVRFGPLVAPLSFRHPAMLAWQAASLDDLSEGRMVLGLGTGWNEREHHTFGHDLGNRVTRLARFEEGLEIITRLLRGDGSVTMEGHFFQVHDARLDPHLLRPGGPPILIGGNGVHRTLPLVARYADAWNAPYVTPELFRERSAHLNGLLRQVGRPPEAVRRTVMVWVICGRDADEIAERGGWLRGWVPEATDEPFDVVLAAARNRLEPWFQSIGGTFCPIVGTPAEVIERIHDYERAGAHEIIVEWWGVDDVAGIHALAEQVMPFV